MKTQVLVIHGGSTFSKREDYLAYLRDRVITLERLKFVDWKGSLQEKLGPDYEVYTPIFTKGNCKYEEWEILFSKILSLLDKEVILIGHSMGGIFLAKYFALNKIKNKVKATILVAAPFDTEDYHDELCDFELPKDLSLIEKQCSHIFIHQSKDDASVPFQNAEKYKAKLPSAKVTLFENRGHFNEAEFPEIIADIKSLVK